MARRFLQETNSTGFRALVVGQHQVHDSWDQIQAFLKARLSAEHAAIFAEPYRGKGSISWMTSSDKEPRLLKDLDEDEQTEVSNKLTSLLGDISALATEMEASKDPQQEQWASLLQEIQRVPSGQELSEVVYEADGQPILLLWGMRDENSSEISALLKERRYVPQEIQKLAPVSPGNRTASGPMGGVLAATPFWAWLLWLLFLILLLIIMWLLLRACAAGLPANFNLFGTCSGPAVVAEAEDERDALLRELERLKKSTAQAPQCRVEHSRLNQTPTPKSTDPNAFAEADTDEEITPDIDPIVDPDTDNSGPSPIPDLDETDIDRARKDAEGQEGDVTITLLWNGQSDLDLMIDCPSGERLSKTRGGENKCGGRVDVDANLCSNREGGRAGAVCTQYRTPPQQNPVENAFFVESGSVAGEYKVLVRHFASSQDAPNATVPFVLQISSKSGKKRYNGTMSPGSLDVVASFSVVQ